MALVTTEAVVLHAFDYMESSRIYRLLTRDRGLQSALAKGARRARARVGSSVDLFAQGDVQLYVKPGRDLHNMAAFDVSRSRAALVTVPGRFTAAAALAELVLRFVQEDLVSGSAVYDAVIRGLDTIAGAAAPATREAGLAAAWSLVSELGFAPEIERCSGCHTPLPAEAAAAFSCPAGGVLCERCAQRGTVKRTLPPRARHALGRWVAGQRATIDDDGDARAHQRLLREFVSEHLTESRELRAFAVWERGAWDAAT
jgi:DNA repair protein RecO (recombination protein O)